MRPKAHNLKDKVKQALAEQEAAGIIRKSFSARSAPLKINITYNGRLLSTEQSDQTRRKPHSKHRRNI